MPIFNAAAGGKCAFLGILVSDFFRYRGVKCLGSSINESVGVALQDRYLVVATVKKKTKHLNKVALKMFQYKEVIRLVQ